MSVLADLEPRVIMDFFDTLTQIPRGSENEKGVSDWVVQFAKDRGLEYHQDDLYCVLVRKPGTPGYENAPTVILHGHLDMVCAKDDGVEFDFLTQGLNLLRDGDYITADGTSLGADNGIGVSVHPRAARLLRHPAPAARGGADLDGGEGQGRRGQLRHVAAPRHADDRLQLDHRQGDPGRLRRRRLRHDRHPRRVGVDGRAEPGRAHAHGPRAHRRPLRVRHPPRAHQRHHPAGARPQHDAGPGIRPADGLAVRRRAEQRHRGGRPGHGRPAGARTRTRSRSRSRTSSRRSRTSTRSRTPTSASTSCPPTFRSGCSPARPPAGSPARSC